MVVLTMEIGRKREGRCCIFSLTHTKTRLTHTTTGVIGGLLGSAFNSINHLLATWRQDALDRQKTKWQWRLTEALTISLITSTAFFYMAHSTPCVVWVWWGVYLLLLLLLFG